MGVEGGGVISSSETSNRPILPLLLEPVEDITTKCEEERGGGRAKDRVDDALEEEEEGAADP